MIHILYTTPSKGIVSTTYYKGYTHSVTLRMYSDEEGTISNEQFYRAPSGTHVIKFDWTTASQVYNFEGLNFSQTFRAEYSFSEGDPDHPEDGPKVIAQVLKKGNNAPGEVARQLYTPPAQGYLNGYTDLEQKTYELQNLEEYLKQVKYRRRRFGGITEAYKTNVRKNYQENLNRLVKYEELGKANSKSELRKAFRIVDKIEENLEAPLKIEGVLKPFPCDVSNQRDRLGRF